MFIARLRPALAGLMLVVFASVASAQDKPTLTHTVSGTTVNLNWTVVPGATSYELFAQIGASTLGPIDVGNSTSVSIPNVPQGVYILAVRGAAGAVKGQFSDPVTVVVGNVAPPAPPAAPSGLAAAINGVSALLSWNLNNPAGSLTSVQLWVATTPGGAPLTALNLGASATSFYIPSAPAGSYYFTVVASGAGGSAASSEFTLTLPGCVAPPTIPLNASTIGTYLTFSWPQLPGANGYALDFANSPGGGANLGTIPFPATVTSFSSYVPEGTYYVTLRSSLSCNGASVSSAETVLTAAAPVRGPAKSQAAAGALVLEAVRAITAQYPGDLQNSCRNHTWLFKVIQYLRTRDNRYGAMLNYKGLAEDILAYNHTNRPDDQVFAPHLYAWDTISGHCGPNPVPWANDITNPNGVATWTILPYLQAGFRP